MKMNQVIIVTGPDEYEVFTMEAARGMLRDAREGSGRPDQSVRLKNLEDHRDKLLGELDAAERRVENMAEVVKVHVEASTRANETVEKLTAIVRQQEEAGQKLVERANLAEIQAGELSAKLADALGKIRRMEEFYEKVKAAQTNGPAIPPPLSPRARKALDEGLEDAKAGRVAEIDPALLKEVPEHVPVSGTPEVPAAVANATKLRPVFEWMIAGGADTPEKLLAKAREIVPAVPALQRIQADGNFDERVQRMAYSMGVGIGQVAAG